MNRIAMTAIAAAVAVTTTYVKAMVPEQVKIDSGTVAGAISGQPTVRVFKGIPFAAPPLGENRWKAPQPVAKWEGVRKADAFGAPCAAGPRRLPVVVAAAVAQPEHPAQHRRHLRRRASRRAAEDCLYLNVWTSATSPNDKRPVMVWIYGGGFTGGSGGLAWYDGENLASKGPVIVTLNYRLGSLGFFAHPELAKESGHNASGNYGMMDAIAALQWVKKNISAFGGDPNNVTIAGESAGAIMVGALVGSPQAKGLFHRAIAESGGWMGLTMGRMTLGPDGAGKRREDDGSAGREDDRRTARKADERAHRPLRGWTHRRRLPHSGRRLAHVHERQAERSRRADRLQQGRSQLRCLPGGRWTRRRPGVDR